MYFVIPISAYSYDNGVKSFFEVEFQDICENILLNSKNTNPKFSPFFVCFDLVKVVSITKLIGKSRIRRVYWKSLTLMVKTLDRQQSL